LVTQILNFGIPAQIDVQVQGRDRAANQKIAGQLRQRLANIPGLVDVHVQQELNAPELSYTIDRARAQQLGLNINSIINNMNISLSSSEQVSPNFWTDPKNGIPYYFAVQTPEYRIASRNDLDNTPITASTSDSSVVPNVLGKRNVDIGSRVHAGDVLAVISAPAAINALPKLRCRRRVLIHSLASAAGMHSPSISCEVCISSPRRA
jgi:multidrug efflux pump subunit AcrB